MQAGVFAISDQDGRQHAYGFCSRVSLCLDLVRRDLGREADFRTVREQKFSGITKSHVPVSHTNQKYATGYKFTDGQILQTQTFFDRHIQPAS